MAHSFVAPGQVRQPADVAQPPVLAREPEFLEPEVRGAGSDTAYDGSEGAPASSDEDPFLDVIVLSCVVLFIALAVGIGVLALQAASVSWPY